MQVNRKNSLDYKREAGTAQTVGPEKQKACLEGRQKAEEVRAFARPGGLAPTHLHSQRVSPKSTLQKYKLLFTY